MKMLIKEDNRFDGLLYAFFTGILKYGLATLRNPILEAQDTIIEPECIVWRYILMFLGLRYSLGSLFCYFSVLGPFDTECDTLFGDKA